MQTEQADGKERLMTTKERRLAEVPLFSSCRRDEFRRIAKLVDEVGVPPGTVLCHQGVCGQQAFVVADGRVGVSMSGRHVATLGPGELVGETALLTGSPRTATVVTLVPTRLFVIDSRRFRSLFLAAPEVGRRIAVLLAERLGEAQALPATG